MSLRSNSKKQLNQVPVVKHSFPNPAYRVYYIIILSTYNKNISSSTTYNHKIPIVRLLTTTTYLGQLKNTIYIVNYLQPQHTRGSTTYNHTISISTICTYNHKYIVLTTYNHNKPSSITYNHDIRSLTTYNHSIPSSTTHKRNISGSTMYLQPQHTQFNYEIQPKNTQFDYSQQHIQFNYLRPCILKC